MTQTTVILSLTSGKADSNTPLKSLVIILLNSRESLFPVLHLPSILNSSYMNRISHQLKEGSILLLEVTKRLFLWHWIKAK